MVRYLLEHLLKLHLSILFFPPFFIFIIFIFHSFSSIIFLSLSFLSTIISPFYSSLSFSQFFFLSFFHNLNLSFPQLYHSDFTSHHIYCSLPAFLSFSHPPCRCINLLFTFPLLDHTISWAYYQHTKQKHCEASSH